MTNPDLQQPHDPTLSTPPGDLASPAPPPAPSVEPAEVQEATAALPEDRLKQLEVQAAAHQEKYLRTLAEFDNYRKRAAREKEDGIRSATENVLERLLPMLDSFEMGLQSVEHGHDAKAVAQGIRMIHGQIQSVMRELGVETIDVTQGTAFDHNYHEALGTLPTEEHPEGAIVNQIRKGYRIKGRLLRPAGVTVARSPES
jgi:molecular chaperone GrpE